MAVPQFGNFSSCCRLCLSENTDSLKSVFDDATGDNALAQKILTFVAVEIQDGDKLSTLVCTSCIEKVNVWISFREYCTKNQVKLEERLSTWISIPEFNFQIKEEVLDDPLDEEIEIVNGDLIRVKSEPIDDEFVEMPSLVAESESQTNSSEGIFKKCRYCAKIFSNSLVRFRHEQRNHSNETEGSESQHEKDKRVPKHKYYKCCLVPVCSSTTITAPNKLFFSVPKDEKMRKKWCLAMKRDVKKSPVSVKSTLHICEDHFNLVQDMENYMQYHLMGQKVKHLRLKTGVIPHIFSAKKRWESS